MNDTTDNTEPNEPTEPTEPSASPSNKRKEQLSRGERKELTRNNLMQAALHLMGEGRSFTSLGLREITREADLMPNAFYRHFRNTDELGLALVDEVGMSLRHLLRQARQVDITPNAMVRRSVQVYHAYVLENRLLFLFISSERAGGSRILRMAIRNEVSHFTHEMAQDFRRLGVYQDLSTNSLHMICGLIVTTMLAAAPEILDLPAGQALLEAEMIENFVQQLQVVLLGAAQWKEKP